MKETIKTSRTAGYLEKIFRALNQDYFDGELEEAIKDSLKQEVSTLIDIKVLPKTMTDGYGAWWHVGVPSVSKNEKVLQHSGPGFY